MTMSGVVYLVGAGPGDPGLLTLRGREVIATADVVIHDYLVDRRLLRFAPPNAVIVPVGESGGASHRDRQQQTINERMVAEARAGRVVVRLNGGDPFVFGRGGEEAQALVDAGIRFEVVPGVSSAIAVPAYAGIPIAERGWNSSFAVVTGHEAQGANPLDWAGLARVETLVFLMGLKTLPSVLARLAAAGKPVDTPAACIRSGTRPDQRTVVGTVADLGERVRDAGFEPPAVVVVGDVVRRREALQWYERRPLLGRKILVTRAAEDAAELVERFERVGAEAIAAPTIELEDLRGSPSLDEALADLESHDWIVFTSAHGVDVFFTRLFEAGGDVRRLGRSRLAAIGPATAGRLARRGLNVDRVPDEYREEALASSLVSEVAGKRVLLPRAEGARDVLPIALRAAGATVADVPTYRARPVAALPERALALFAADALDAITFTSSSTVRHFHALLAGAGVRIGRAKIAAIGPVTAETVRSLGWSVDVEAVRYTTDGLVAALIDYYSGHS